MSTVEKASGNGRPVDPEAATPTVVGETTGQPDIHPEVLSSKLTFWIAMVLLAAALILTFASVQPVARHPAQKQPQKKLWYKGTRCPFSEIFEYPLICFVNYESPVPGFTYENIPTQFCRHVVLCCMGVDVNMDLPMAIAKGTVLQLSIRRAKRFLGFGGPNVHYFALTTTLNDSAKSAQLTKGLVRAMNGGAFFGGIALMLPDAVKITSPGLAQFFAKNLAKAMNFAGGVRKTLIVQLSSQAQDVKVTYQASTFASKDIIPMMTTHIPPDHRQKLHYATCASPYRSADPRHSTPDFFPHEVSVSMERGISMLKLIYGPEWPDVEKEVMVSVSLAWLQFDHHDKTNRSAGTPAKFEGLIPYPDICLNTCSGPRHQRFQDMHTDCEVDWDGERIWYSGLGQHAGAFMRAHPGIRGVGVFDIDYDDFKGVCRQYKFPQLQAVHDILREV